MTGSKQRTTWAVTIMLASVLLLTFIVVVVPLVIPKPEPFEPSTTPEMQPLELVIEDEPPSEEIERQVVSLNEPESEEPDEADFLDRVNRSTDEEMVAPDPIGEPVRVGAAAVVPQPQVEPIPVTEPADPQPTVEVQEIEEPEPVEEAETEPEQPPVEPDDVPTESEESVSDVDGELAGGDPPQPTVEQADTPQIELPPSVDWSAFQPTMDNAGDLIAVPGAPTIDHLDLPQGDRTQINSYEDMYWSFWDRIKTQVRPYWRPNSIYRNRDPTGRIFGVEDRYTIVRVTLNGDGSLRHVYLERTCDLDFLDREAIHAIEAAEPYSNVPEGLKDENGLLSFRFGFYFEVSSSSFRIRREDW